VDQETYDLDANKVLLKYYLLYPSNVKITCVVKVGMHHQVISMQS
jgi:hypothetical protein